jgi:5'-methylthioadenosine phosphorylase
VTDLVSLSACGSFKEELPPGTFVLIDQFVDRTHARASSFFGTGCVAHVSMAHPVSPRLRIHLAEAAIAEGINILRDGTYVCMEGPQFSTLAESLTFKNLGYSVIGMTNMPEAKLAREAEICYATVAMVTDFDCWHPDHDAGHRAGHHQGSYRQRKEGEATGGASRQRYPTRAPAVPARFRSGAR